MEITYKIFEFVEVKIFYAHVFKELLDSSGLADYCIILVVTCPYLPQVLKALSVLYRPLRQVVPVIR